MDFGLALLNMHPNISPSQYEIMQNPDGTFSIMRWDPTDIPQPVESDVIEYWNNQMMDYFRSKKKEALSEQCNVAITSGFTSSALGVAHTYPSDLEAQLNFNTEMHRFLADPNYTSCHFKTLDAGYMVHTREEFFKVFADGHDYGAQQIAKLNDLKVQVDSAQTQADLDKITW